MVDGAKQKAIRRCYRRLRIDIDKTQEAVAALARRHYPEFGPGRYWKIENGRDFPTPSERRALAKVLKVPESDLPSEETGGASA